MDEEAATDTGLLPDPWEWATDHATLLVGSILVLALLVVVLPLALTVVSQHRELTEDGRDVPGPAPRWDRTGYLTAKRVERLLAAQRKGSFRGAVRAAGDVAYARRWKKELAARGPLIAAFASPYRRGVLFEPVNGDAPVALAGMAARDGGGLSVALLEYHGGLTAGRLEAAADTLSAEWGYVLTVRRAADGIAVLDIEDADASK